MNVTQKGMVTLMKSAITGEAYELPEEFSLESEESKELIKKHHLMQLVYVGAVNCHLPADTPFMKQLFSVYLKHLVRSERQMAAVEKVFRAFDEHGIDYLPTKGCNMKALYPKPEMRIMGDADITIRKEQLPKIKEVMTDLGFTLKLECYNDDVWENKDLLLELHKHMCCFYNEAYYDDVWERVKMVSGHRYAFSTEDAFVHIFNHFTKHYRNAGIGCRHLVDLYVYRRTFPQMDEKYILSELKKMQQHKFYKTVCAAIDMWFGDGALQNNISAEAIEAVMQHVFNSGSWGNIESYAVARQVVRANKDGEVANSRFKAIIRSIFPPLSHMVITYGILERAPYLLPFTWVWRAVKVVLFKRRNIELQMRQWRAVEDDAVSAYQKQFKLVGLDVEE